MNRALLLLISTSLHDPRLHDTPLTGPKIFVNYMRLHDPRLHDGLVVRINNVSFLCTIVF